MHHAAPAALFERAMKAKQLSPQAAQGRRTCVVCRLRLNDPLKARLIEQRLALGASVNELARETGIERHGLTRHYQKHCDQKAILREVHKADRDATVAELFARANIEDRSPLRICDEQIQFYQREFETLSCNGDREARDQADKRLFTWTKLKHQVVTPLSQQYGPVTNNVQNNTIITAATDLGALVALMEAKLARRPPEQRRQMIALLREVAAGDAPVEVTALVDGAE
jgi:transposase-like protein